MKKEDLRDAIGNIKDKHLLEADKYRYNKKRIINYQKWILVAAAFAIVLYSSIRLFVSKDSITYVLAKANIPEISDKKYEDMTEKEYNEKIKIVEDLRKTKKDYDKGLKEFFEKSKNIIIDSNSNENQLYSPVNMYIAYSMLAEMANGDSRDELLKLLGSKTIENLREDVNSIWRTNYIIENSGILKLANSIWLKKNDNEMYNKKTLDILSNKYYASVFSGDFNETNYSKEFVNWINENTNNLLKDLLKDFRFDPSTVLSLASTIYLKDSWTNSFDEYNNTKENFKTKDGDKELEFMNNEFTDSVYYKDKDFVATNISLANTNAKMWVFLPNEDKNISDIMNSNKIINIINGEIEGKLYDVMLSMPKFSIETDTDMIEKTKEMGVHKIFSNEADFSNISNSSLYVSEILHKAKTIVDEEGLEAAAATIVEVKEMAMEVENLKKVEVKLNRPFVFVITGYDDIPLFTGVVNNPAQ